jgi:pyruvate formate lyase activating enzyme
MKAPLILEIKGNSLDDGPGIRSVIFYKGCPLSCVWCHNPESKRMDLEISFDPKECVGCDTCVKLCTVNALSRKKKDFIDRKKCTLCFACADACPSGALSQVGKKMTFEDIVQTVLRDKPFFENSGGGVTLSGGEPTLFMEFTSMLLRALKKERVHTLLETCGLFDWNVFEEIAAPFLDAVYFDIKIFDSAAHKKHCGVGNEKILANFERILLLAEKKKIQIMPRTPLVPGITDTDENIAAIAAYLKKLGVKKSVLLPYNPLWHEKTRKIGSEDPMEKNSDAAIWMALERVEGCRNIFLGSGIQV